MQITHIDIKHNKVEVFSSLKIETFLHADGNYVDHLLMEACKNDQNLHFNLNLIAISHERYSNNRWDPTVLDSNVTHIKRTIWLKEVKSLFLICCSRINYNKFTAPRVNVPSQNFQRSMCLEFYPKLKIQQLQFLKCM